MSTPLPAWLLPLTIPASWLYGAAIRVRNAKYDRPGSIGMVDRPVISIGNITAGGTGKTPMVTWIAGQLLDHGVCPAVALRGYGAKAGDISDEHAEYLHHLPDVPVIARPDRLNAIREFLDASQGGLVDCILLDDGFQHRQLHRDLDLVLIDAQRDVFSDRLLPAGHLREPLRNLKRADAVIMTRADETDERLAQRVANCHGHPPIAWSRHQWAGLDVYGERIMPTREPVDWFRGKRVLTMLGVGHPQSIHRQIEAAGATILADLPVSDHESYDRSRLAVARGLAEPADAMVVTNKDWVKIAEMINLSDWPTPIVVPHLEINVFNGAKQFMELVLSAVNQKVGNHQSATMAG